MTGRKQSTSAPKQVGGATNLLPGVVDTKQEEEEYRASLDKYLGSNGSDLQASPMRIACLSEISTVASSTRTIDIENSAHSIAEEFQETNRNSPQISWSARSSEGTSSSDGSLFSGTGMEDIVTDAEEEDGTRLILVTPPSLDRLTNEAHGLFSNGCEDLEFDYGSYSGLEVDLRTEKDSSMSKDGSFKDDKFPDGDSSLFGDYSLPGRSIDGNDSEQLSVASGENVVQFHRVPSKSTGYRHGYDEIFLRFGLATDGGNESVKYSAHKAINGVISPDRTSRTTLDTQTSVEDSEEGLSGRREQVEELPEATLDQNQNDPLLRLFSTKVFGIIRLDVLACLLILFVIALLIAAVAMSLDRKPPTPNSNQNVGFTEGPQVSPKQDQLNHTNYFP